MDEKTLKDKLRELFEKIKQTSLTDERYYPLIFEKNGETIFCQYDLDTKIICFRHCNCDWNEGVDLNEPVLALVKDILQLAFEFTQE
tara:strand:+ start:370 stop:630 length:261 start_codon:yes stop_codon:yes gene_type:complete